MRRILLASDTTMDMKMTVPAQPNEASNDDNVPAAAPDTMEMTMLKTETPLEPEEEKPPQLVQEGSHLVVSLGKRQLAALDSGFMTDVVILVGEETIKCHSNIVSFASPKLAAVIKEKEPRLPDVDPRNFRLLLEIIYSETTSQSQDVETLLQVGQLAFELQVHAALVFCTACLTEKVDTENLWSILDFAFLIGDAELEEICLEMIRTKTAIILQTEGFLMCKRTTFELILKQDKLHRDVTELQLFQACVAWAKANSGGTDQQAAGVDSALRLIRFRTFSAEEFAQHVCPTGLLSAEIERDILRSCATGENFMPEGFSNIASSRDPKRNLDEFLRLVREKTDNKKQPGFPLLTPFKTQGRTGYFGHRAH